MIVIYFIIRLLDNEFELLFWSHSNRVFLLDFVFFFLVYIYMSRKVFVIFIAETKSILHLVD